MNLARESAAVDRKFQGRDLDESNDERSRRVGDLQPDWAGREGDAEVVMEMLSIFREANPPDACRWVFDRFIEGKLQAAAVWDAIFLTAAEFVIRFKLGGPSGQAQHSVTSMNALHFAFRACADQMLAERRIQGFDVTGWGAIFSSVPHFEAHTQEIVCFTRMQLGEAYKSHWQPRTAEEASAQT